jgi:hypothetical protein
MKRETIVVNEERGFLLGSFDVSPKRPSMAC